MASITVRKIPENVKDSLAQRAKAAGESLESYLRRLLAAEASRNSAQGVQEAKFDQVLSRFRNLPPGKTDEPTLSDLIEENRSRDQPATEL